jgi:hypothetical protein
MKHITRMALMVGLAAGALWAVSGDRGYTQANHNRLPRSAAEIGFPAHPLSRLRRPKESASTMPAMSMAVGPVRWRYGAGPRADLSDNAACFHPPRTGRVISSEARRFTSPASGSVALHRETRTIAIVFVGVPDRRQRLASRPGVAESRAAGRRTGPWGR